MRNSIYIYILLLIFTLQACKSELTLPSKVLFSFAMEDFELEEAEEEDDAKGGGQLEIDEGIMAIDAIEFEGKRMEGEDVYFISDFPEQIIANLTNESTNIAVDFDIPQGIYYQIDIRFYLGAGPEMPLVLKGMFEPASSEEIPVRFEYDFEEIIEVRVNKPGVQNIVLSKETISEAQVTVDVKSLFRFVTMGEIVNANLTEENGTTLLLINNYNNPHLANKLANRLAQSIIVEFE